MSQLTKTQSDIANIDRSALAERLVTAGDLVSLTAVERVQYYLTMCDRCGLDPLSRPFDYIKTFENGKEKIALYPNQIAAAQLRRMHKVSMRVIDRRSEDGLYMVTCEASTPDGRKIESMGVVPMVDKDGKAYSPTARANAIKKSETQAYRRATIAICGLDFSSVDEDGGTVMQSEFYDPPIDAVDLSTAPQRTLNEVKQVEVVQDAAESKYLTNAEGEALWKMAKATGHTAATAKEVLSKFGVTSFKAIPIARSKEIQDALTAKIAREPVPSLD